MMAVAREVSARIKGSVMRRSLGLVALCLFAFATPSNAQDFDTPTLRGTSPFIPAPPIYTRWGGFYGGVQIGRSSADMNFAGATEGLIAHLLRNTALEDQHRPSEWVVLGKSNPSGLSYGLFVGYNAQFQDVVLGVDFHYNRSSFDGVAPVTPIDRIVTANGIQYDITVTGSSSMRITDYGAARVRGGWVVGNFLPYATVGFAVGRADITRTAQTSGTQNPTPNIPCTDPGNNCVPFNLSATEAKNAQFLYGWSAGGGVDVLLMPNFFVRAEFEYIGFTKSQEIEAHVGTARVGAGVKF